MEPAIIPSPRYTKLKIAIDVLSVVCITFSFGDIFLSVTGIYDPHGNEPGNQSLEIKLLLVDLLPTVFGMFWLAFRYVFPLMERHQKASQRLVDMVAIMGSIFGAFVVYKIYGVYGSILFLIPIGLAIFSRIKK